MLTCCLFKGDSLSYSVGMYFSTKDSDNDNITTHHCAEMEKGGWWYNRCSRANLNGKYLYGATDENTGVVWSTWKGWQYSLDSVTMMVREHRAA